MSTKSWPRTCHSSCVTARAVRPCNPIWLHHSTGCFFPHSSLSPPFHHATACPTNTGRYAMVPAAIKRSKTREVRVTGGRTPRFSRTTQEYVGLGFSISMERAPRKFGRWKTKRKFTKNGYSRCRPSTFHNSRKYTPRSS